jgi:hypothetical protein
MKRLFSESVNTVLRSFVGLALLAVMIVGCSNNPDKLSSGTIEDLVEELLEESGQEQSFVQVQTGMYELNSQQDRAQLMRLEAAGVINYDVKRYAWWNKILSVSSSWSWNDHSGFQRERIGNTYYEFEEHFVVTVSLTDAGRKCQVDSIPQPKVKEDDDMKQPDVDFSTFPENQISLTEEWPYIPNPEAPQKADKPAKVTVDLAETPEEEEDPGCETDEEDYDAPQKLSLDIETSMAYEELQQQFKSESAILKSSRLEVKKARFIQLFDNAQSGVRCATAEVIIEMSDVTPAGRVIEGKCNGIRFCSPVSMVFYADKGWILQDRTLHLSHVSNLGVAASENGSIEY